MKYVTILLFLSIPGMISSQEKLDVQGAIILNQSEDPTPVPGTIRWTGKDFQGWNGYRWLSLTAQPLGMVMDVQQNQYNTVVIGTQEWMVENLRVTAANDGTPIPKVTDNTIWANITVPAYCWYNNDSVSHAAIYGALYNYYVVADTNSSNVCPTGWHVPSDAEWNVLIGFIDPDFNPNAFIDPQSLIAGGKIKETGTQHWQSPNLSDNVTGFTARPAGFRFESTFTGNLAYWWSSTQSDPIFAWLRAVYGDIKLYRFNFQKSDGNSIRCIKN